MGTVRSGATTLAARVQGTTAISGELVVYGTAYNHAVTAAQRYVTSGEMAVVGGATPPGGNDTELQFNDASSFAGDAALTWQKTPDVLTVSGELQVYGAARFGNTASQRGTRISAAGDVQVSGFTRLYRVLDVRDLDSLYGLKVDPYSAIGGGGLTWTLYGSGYVQGPVLHYRLQNSPSLDRWIDLPAQFDAGVQVSGGGAARCYEGATFGATATPYTKISAAGDVQTSGALRVYHNPDHLLFLIDNAKDRGVGIAAGEALTGVVFGGAHFGLLGSGIVLGSLIVRPFTTNDQLRSLSPIVALDNTQLSGELRQYGLTTFGATATPRARVSAAGELQLSGALTRVYGRLDVTDGDQLYGVRLSALNTLGGGLGFVQIGSGYHQGSQLHYTLQNVPSVDRWIDLPVAFHAGMQTSGVVVAYHPVYATAQTAAGRYVTSGDLGNLPSAPGGTPSNVQFHDSGGGFGGSPLFRWDDASSTLTVSGSLDIPAGSVQIYGGTGALRVGPLSDDNRHLTVYGAGQQGAGVGENLLFAGSGLITGRVEIRPRFLSFPQDRLDVRLPTVFDGFLGAGVQVSGELRQYAPVTFGATDSPYTKISSAGDVQVSGAMRVYHTHGPGHRLFFVDNDSDRGVAIATTEGIGGVIFGGAMLGVTGSGIVLGSLIVRPFTANDQLRALTPIVALDNVQASGVLRAYDQAQFGASATPGTRISSIGDVQVSGVLKVYDQVSVQTPLRFTTSTAASGVVRFQNLNNNAGDRWWLAFTHGSANNDGAERARIGCDIVGGGGGRLFFSTGFSNTTTERARIDEVGNVLVNTATSPTAAAGVAGPMLVLASGQVVPTTMPTGAAGLYTINSGGTYELRAVDSAGNFTTISSHNFDLFDPPSDAAYPWSFHAVNPLLGVEVGVDMWRLARLVERLTGEQLIHVRRIERTPDAEARPLPRWMQRILASGIPEKDS